MLDTKMEFCGFSSSMANKDRHYRNELDSRDTNHSVLKLFVGVVGHFPICNIDGIQAYCLAGGNLLFYIAIAMIAISDFFSQEN